MTVLHNLPVVVHRLSRKGGGNSSTLTNLLFDIIRSTISRFELTLLILYLWLIPRESGGAFLTTLIFPKHACTLVYVKRKAESFSQHLIF